MRISRFTAIMAVAAAVVAGTGVVYARNMAFQAINRDFVTGRIDKAKATEYRLYAALAPGRLPSAYQRIETSRPVRPSSLDLATLKRDFTVLPKAVQDEFSRFFARPTLPRIEETEHFMIHYTRTGGDAVTLAFLDSVAAAAEFVWDREVDGLGYDAPPVDNVSDPKYDIFIINMDDYDPVNLYYGLTFWETSNGAGYMLIDNDYMESDYATKGVTALKVTLAHEFFHAVQFGYVGFSTFIGNEWWMEISSAWMEDVAYDGINDYLQYLEGGSGWFANPHLSLYTYDGWHEYGSCIFNHYLVRKYGIDIIKDIWEAARSASSAANAVDNGLAGVGTSLDEAFTEFIGWLPFTGTRADTVTYFPEGHLYPEVRLETTVDLSSQAQLSWTYTENVVNYPLDDYGCTIVRIDSLGVLPDSSRTLAFNGKGGDSWCLTVVLQPTGTAAPVNMLGGRTGEYVLPESTDAVSVFLCAGMLDKSAATDTSAFTYGFSEGVAAAVTKLYSCFPNPFKPALHEAVYFPFSLSDPAIDLSIYIYTENGQLVRELPVNPSFAYEYRTREALSPRGAVWDGTNGQGKPVASGTYYYRFHVADDDSKGLKTLAVIR